MLLRRTARPTRSAQRRSSVSARPGARTSSSDASSPTCSSSPRRKRGLGSLGAARAQRAQASHADAKRLRHLTGWAKRRYSYRPALARADEDAQPVLGCLMRPSLLTTLPIAAACAEGDVSTLPDAGSITPGAEAGFACPDPLDGDFRCWASRPGRWRGHGRTRSASGAGDLLGGGLRLAYRLHLR